jgi:hypothetical protein
VVDYKEKIVNLLEEQMTEKAFKLWKGINSLLPDTWNHATSSTGKWHKKLNGEIPNQAEHVYQMLYAASKVMRLFGYEPKTTDGDKILFALVLHDSLKYGTLGTRKFTDAKHDKEAADMVSSNRGTFTKVLTEEQFYTMEEMIRFHSGQWSTDIPKDKKFDFKDYNPETLFVHILDMMSTADLIQTDERE